MVGGVEIGREFGGPSRRANIPDIVVVRGGERESSNIWGLPSVAMSERGYL